MLLTRDVFSAQNPLGMKGQLATAAADLFRDVWKASAGAHLHETAQCVFV